MFFGVREDWRLQPFSAGVFGERRLAGDIRQMLFAGARAPTWDLGRRSLHRCPGSCDYFRKLMHRSVDILNIIGRAHSGSTETQVGSREKTIQPTRGAISGVEPLGFRGYKALASSVCTPGSDCLPQLQLPFLTACPAVLSRSPSECRPYLQVRTLNPKP